MQFVVTPVAGKRLIAKAVAKHTAVLKALQDGTVVIVAGTTNGYVAEELLRAIGQSEGFTRKRFFRGVTLPSSSSTTKEGLLPGESLFPGDVVIRGSAWQRGKTIFDVVDDLREGDVILKGANAVDLQRRQAAILIGHPKGGTIAVALQAVVGRRVRLILPVGLEKRVHKDLNQLAAILNTPGAHGPRLLPVPGEPVTEIEALAALAGVRAELVAGGGVWGAEGAVRLVVMGTDEELRRAQDLLLSIADEPPFTL